MIPAGLAGIKAMVGLEPKELGDQLEAGKKAIDTVQGIFTYNPKMEAAHDILRSINKPFEFWREFSQYSGDQILDLADHMGVAPGNPLVTALATISSSSIEALPWLLAPEAGRAVKSKVAGPIEAAKRIPHKAKGAIKDMKAKAYEATIGKAKSKIQSKVGGIKDAIKSREAAMIEAHIKELTKPTILDKGAKALDKHMPTFKTMAQKAKAVPAKVKQLKLSIRKKAELMKMKKTAKELRAEVKILRGETPTTSKAMSTREAITKALSRTAEEVKQTYFDAKAAIEAGPRRREILSRKFELEDPVLRRREILSRKFSLEEPTPTGIVDKAVAKTKSLMDKYASEHAKAKLEGVLPQKYKSKRLWGPERAKAQHKAMTEHTARPSTKLKKLAERLKLKAQIKYLKAVKTKTKLGQTVGDKMPAPIAKLAQKTGEIVKRGYEFKKAPLRGKVGIVKGAVTDLVDRYAGYELPDIPAGDMTSLIKGLPKMYSDIMPKTGVLGTRIPGAKDVMSKIRATFGKSKEPIQPEYPIDPAKYYVEEMMRTRYPESMKDGGSMPVYHQGGYVRKTGPIFAQKGELVVPQQLADGSGKGEPFEVDANSLTNIKVTAEIEGLDELKKLLKAGILIKGTEEGVDLNVDEAVRALSAVTFDIPDPQFTVDLSTTTVDLATTTVEVAEIPTVIVEATLTDNKVELADPTVYLADDSREIRVVATLDDPTVRLADDSRTVRVEGGVAGGVGADEYDELRQAVKSINDKVITVNKKVDDIDMTNVVDQQAVEYTVNERITQLRTEINSDIRTGMSDTQSELTAFQQRYEHDKGETLRDINQIKTRVL